MREIDVSEPGREPQYVEDGDKIIFGEINQNIILQAPLVCCDCGLAHDMNFELDAGVLSAKPVRNEELTGRRLHKRRIDR